MPTRKCENWKSGGATEVAVTSPPLSAPSCPSHKTSPKMSSACASWTITWEPSKLTTPSRQSGGFAVLSFTRPALPAQMPRAQDVAEDDHGRRLIDENAGATQPHNVVLPTLPWCGKVRTCKRA